MTSNRSPRLEAAAVATVQAIDEMHYCEMQQGSQPQPRRVATIAHVGAGRRGALDALTAAVILTLGGGRG